MCHRWARSGPPSTAKPEAPTRKGATCVPVLRVLGRAAGPLTLLHLKEFPASVTQGAPRGCQRGARTHRGVVRPRAGVEARTTPRPFDFLM